MIDRDRKSFTSGSGQYEYVLDRYKEKGFGFYLTNPCFEFWLLLHMEDLSDLDEKKLLENGMATSTMNYAEHELRRKLREAGGPNFKKGGYNPSWFMERINLAIANERMYCEDEAGLEGKWCAVQHEAISFSSVCVVLIVVSTFFNAD